MAFWLLASPARGWAHALPLGVDLAWVDQSSDAFPVIVTNRGLIFPRTMNREPTYTLRCAEAFGANASDRPLAYLDGSGTLTLGVYDGVLRTQDDGCTLTKALGLPNSTPVGDLVSARSAPERMYLATRGLEGKIGVFVSEDSGGSFTLRFANKPDEYYQTLVVAPSDSLRLYALGLHYDRASLSVSYYTSTSEDGGNTWRDTAVAEKLTPFAVHPTKSDIVLAYRPTDKRETNFDILRSEDRGKTYSVVLPGVSVPTGLAAGTGQGTLFLGMSTAGGLYRSLDDGKHFEPLLAEQVLRVTCLAEHAGKLWVCANLRPNQDAIWQLRDDASGFDKVMSFDAVTEPVGCADQGPPDMCSVPWRDFELEVRPMAVDGGGLSDSGVDAALDAPGGSEIDRDADEESNHASAEDDTADHEMPAAGGGRCQTVSLPTTGGLSARSLFIALVTLTRRRFRPRSASEAAKS